jgi:hypothetical protein
MGGRVVLHEGPPEGLSPDFHARVRHYGASACLTFLGLGVWYGGTALILAPDGHLLGLLLNGLHAARWACRAVSCSVCSGWGPC